MSQSSKKQTFLHGAVLLAMATAIVKIIGAFYKIPLNRIIDEQGFGYFNTAYNIYAVLLMICTAGLPIAMSRMISEASSTGNYNQVRRVYMTSRAIFLGLGLVSTALMMGFARQLAAFQKQPDAWVAIFCLGPCALLMCVMSTFRGFFQGQGNMRPTSNSQILEAFFKLFIGLALAYGIMKATGSVAYAAGGAILGVTASCLVSSFYLYGQLRPAYRDLPVTDDVPLSYGKTARKLLAIAVPITIGSAGLQILTVIETNLYMGQLLNGGMSQGAADTTKGIYDMCFTVFNMPCSFMVPITTAVLPAITAFLSTGDKEGTRNTEESAARITGLLSLPCAVGLTILAQPVMGLLGGYGGENLVLAGKILTVLGANIFFYAIIQYTNVVLQSHGYAFIPVINMLLCGGLKLIVVYMLVGNPQIGIVGAPIGMLLCYGCIGAMNFIAIRRVVPGNTRILQNLLRPVLPAALMGVGVWAVQKVLYMVPALRGSRVIVCGASVTVGVVLYLVGVIVFKTIRREDCLLLPKGDKIAKFLHL